MTDDEAGISWRVKTSFVNYLLALGGGVRAVSDGARSAEGGVFFPLAEQSGFDFPSAQGVIRFRGRVRFSGHFGALDLVLAEPWLTADDNGGSISFETGSGRLPLVALGPTSTAIDGGLVIWPEVSTRLLPEATSLFNEVYAPGEAFDPVTIRIRMP